VQNPFFREEIYSPNESIVDGFIKRNGVFHLDKNKGNFFVNLWYLLPLLLIK